MNKLDPKKHRPDHRLVLVMLMLVSACTSDERDAAVHESPASRDSATQTVQSNIAGSDVIQTSTIIYVDATHPEILELKSKKPEDDFYIIADDLMFYRATAIEFLEKNAIPFTRLDGRRPMSFRVAGSPRRYDFADVELLDFIIVYTQDREPRIVAPVDVHTITGDTAAPEP